MRGGGVQIFEGVAALGADALCVGALVAEGVVRLVDRLALARPAAAVRRGAGGGGGPSRGGREGLVLVELLPPEDDVLAAAAQAVRWEGADEPADVTDGCGGPTATSSSACCRGSSACSGTSAPLSWLPLSWCSFFKIKWSLISKSLQIYLLTHDLSKLPPTRRHGSSLRCASPFAPTEALRCASGVSNSSSRRLYGPF
jgi:hypothetical protein